MLLITIASGPNRGRAVRLSPDARHVIGRNTPPLDLDDTKVSRRHAELIAFPDGQVIVKDLGSRNGTFVDKQKVTGPTPLRDGAVVQVGKTAFVFSRVAEAIAAMPPAPTTPPPELAEAQEQTRRVLAEVRDGLRQLQSSPATPSASQLELVQASILRRLDEVSQKLHQVSHLAECQAATGPAIVRSLAPQLDAILAGQSRPVPATESIASQVTELHRKLDAMAKEASPSRDDTSVHARIDDMVDALNKLAEPELESPPVWLNGLERRLDAIAISQDSRGALDALAGKVQTLIGAFHAAPRIEGPTVVLQAKLDAVLHAVQSAPHAPQADTSIISAKLDDLLGLVAAQVMSQVPVSEGGDPVVPVPIHSAEMDARLDAILMAVQSLAAQPAAQSTPAMDVGTAEALLLHVAERIDALASQPAAAPVAEELVAEVDRHWVKLEERLMQHLRGTGEATENQMRKAIADLTAAVRTMADRSDRVVLEQVLGEVRGNNTRAMQEMLEEINERVRRLPVSAAGAGAGGAGHAVENQVVVHAVKQAFQQVGEQLQSLPGKLNNNLVLGDILDLLRSIERHQRHQSQWLSGIDQKLDNLGASETAVFAPITDATMDPDPSGETASLTTDF